MKVKDIVQWLMEAPLNADFFIGSMAEGNDDIIYCEPNRLVECTDGSIGLIYDPNKKEDEG